MCTLIVENEKHGENIRTSVYVHTQQNNRNAHIVGNRRHHYRIGMASMIMPEKKVFRARVLDPTKRLTVRFCQKCQSQSPKIKRAVAVPPSGMEKEEEMVCILLNQHGHRCIFLSPSLHNLFFIVFN